MEMTDPRRRLLDLATRHGHSLSELSRMIGRNGTYLQQFVRKGSPRKLEETDRRTLARFFGVGEGELGAPEEISSRKRQEMWAEIARLALGAAAGSGTIVDREAPAGVFGFSRRWLREQGLDPAQLSAIRVEGDSMEPLLRDGDEILVDRTPRPLRAGVHVVRLGDALLVKRLDTGRPEALALISDNPAYPPIELTPGEVEVIGRVVWKSGRL